MVENARRITAALFGIGRNAQNNVRGLKKSQTLATKCEKRFVTNHLLEGRSSDGAGTTANVTTN